MTTVTVSVDATPRVSRFEFSTPHLPTGMVYGYSEVLLQSPDGEAPSILHVRSPMIPAPKEGEKVTYGVMPGAMVSRGIPAVMEETVEVDGVTISINTVLKAMGEFLEKWRIEDENTPAPVAAAAVAPPVLDVQPPPEHPDPVPFEDEQPGG